MINTLSSNTNQEILEILVEIHKNCISETNSKFYNRNQIKEWLSTVKSQSIQDQLNNTSWITIEVDKIIVGFAQYCLEDKELYQIQIDPKEQGKGYGKELYNYIEKDFKRNKILSISLYATLNAVPFYEKLGFKTVKKIEFLLVKSNVQMVEMLKALI